MLIQVENAIFSIRLHLAAKIRSAAATFLLNFYGPRSWELKPGYGVFRRTLKYAYGALRYVLGITGRYIAMQSLVLLYGVRLLVILLQHSRQVASSLHFRARLVSYVRNFSSIMPDSFGFQSKRRMQAPEKNLYKYEDNFQAIQSHYLQ